MVPVRGPVPTRRPRSADVAAAWCVVFAGLHVYWASGGDMGLASSAGLDLAARRPLLFVLVGLWGTAMVLLLGAAFSAALTRSRPRSRWRRLAVLTAWLVGIVLLARGVVLELVLLADVGGAATSVGPFETRWSLVLWNPWFVLGGTAFLLMARRAAPVGRTRGVIAGHDRDPSP